MVSFWWGLPCCLIDNYLLVSFPHGRDTHTEKKFSDISSYKGTNPVMGFPGGSVVKNLPANAGHACRIPRFDPCIGRSSWRRKWQPIPVFLPRMSHGQRSLEGHGPWPVTKSRIQLSNWESRQSRYKDPPSWHYVCMLSCFRCAWLFVTLWTVACQALLSLGFSRQEYWSELPSPPPGDLPDPGIEPWSPMSPELISRFFASWATWDAPWWPHPGLTTSQTPHLLIISPWVKVST